MLAADIAGYSRLMGRDEEHTLAQLKAFRKTLVDPGITAHRGRIVKTTGDGMPITNPVEAMVTALKLPERAVLFVHLADAWLRCPIAMQAVWNLRDAFKSDNRLLVMLSKMGRLPAELTAG